MLPQLHHRVACRLGLAIMLGVMLGLPLLCGSGLTDVASAASTPPPAGHRLEACLVPVVTAAMQELQVPGVIIGVWIPGEKPWTAALGTANLATGVPLTLADRMRIGSITKTFTGTVILQLADEGKLALDDTIARYVPGVPNGEQITIRQLGNMTSGLFNYSEDQGLLAAMDADPSTGWTPQELIAIANMHPPYFAPGKGWHYSNTNIIILGLIIEKVTGHSVQEEYRRRIFEPLGMEHTHIATNGVLRTPHAHGYMYGTLLQPGIRRGVSPRDVTAANPSWGWAAAGLVSTLNDLQRYAGPLATGQLVSQKSQAERLRWVDVGTRPKGLQYGFTIADFGGAIGHNGKIAGFQSFMGYIPANHATIIVLTNLFAAAGDKGPADELAKRIMQALQELHTGRHSGAKGDRKPTM
jgi:D-alanyl-D-alanine carboxypeptidase